MFTPLGVIKPLNFNEWHDGNSNCLCYSIPLMWCPEGADSPAECSFSPWDCAVPSSCTSSGYGNYFIVNDTINKPNKSVFPKLFFLGTRYFLMSTPHDPILHLPCNLERSAFVHKSGDFEKSLNMTIKL